ncbi:sulfatase family protein [Alkalibacillus haloalkaliphilus]|uniref:Putative sulfatase n=1 Tax=Alkalibacillus haloalkaliphilus TaxID=94136 RepID=A0A511W970_9BACI|nr:sulfatase [Alkalibacillus haloalkaliphilus]GEN46613.1 putative sulfatase [Alkalibacillus haloalkaliphilus]
MQRPNIVFIISHDTGRYLGTYGRNVETPEIDELASEGIQFNQYFCSQPQCSPSRGSIMTGRYGHNHGMMGLAHMGHSIYEQLETIPSELNKIGYRTSLIGLYHESVNDEFDPYKLGYQNYQQVPGNWATDVTDHFVDFLKEENKRDDDSPFYVSLGFEETHRPFDDYEPVDLDEVVLPDYLPDTEEVRKDFAQFYRSGMDMDDAVGRIKRAIKEQGFDDNTIIIFTTDHGIAFPRAKGTLYDSGLETAFLMKFPEGMYEQGYQSDALLCNVDLMPTIFDLVDCKVPEGVDGVSFLPLIEGEVEQTRDHFFAEMTWHDKYHPMRGVRTQKYKYIRNFEDGPKVYMPYDLHTSLTGEVVRDEYYVPNVDEELYDLEADPAELNNIASDEAYREVVADLRAKVDQWMEASDDPLLKGRVPGYEAEEWETVDDDYESRKK